MTHPKAPTRKLDLIRHLETAHPDRVKVSLRVAGWTVVTLRELHSDLEIAAPR